MTISFMERVKHFSICWPCVVCLLPPIFFNDNLTTLPEKVVWNRCPDCLNINSWAQTHYAFCFDHLTKHLPVLSSFQPSLPYTYILSSLCFRFFTLNFFQHSLLSMFCSTRVSGCFSYLTDNLLQIILFVDARVC